MVIVSISLSIQLILGMILSVFPKNIFPRKLKQIPGTSRECHRNSCLLWRNNTNVTIVTGYALSDDGLWRQHTWCIMGEEVWESTTRRELYFGYVLNTKEAEKFYAENI